MGQPTFEQQQSSFYPTLLICGVNTPECVQLLVNKPEFVLGKSEECDGILSFNDEISRRHCVVSYKDGEYSIMDCESTNGTFLNGSQLDKGITYPLAEGDRLRLSTSTFIVEKLYNTPARIKR